MRAGDEAVKHASVALAGWDRQSNLNADYRLPLNRARQPHVHPTCIRSSSEPGPWHLSCFGIGRQRWWGRRQHGGGQAHRPDQRGRVGRWRPRFPRRGCTDICEYGKRPSRAIPVAPQPHCSPARTVQRPIRRSKDGMQGTARARNPMCCARHLPPCSSGRTRLLSARQARSSAPGSPPLFITSAAIRRKRSVCVRGFRTRNRRWTSGPIAGTGSCRITPPT